MHALQKLKKCLLNKHNNTKQRFYRIKKATSQEVAFLVYKDTSKGLGERSIPKYKSAAASKVGLLFKQGGRDCRRAQAGQHNEAVSEPRTSWRWVRELTAASGGCREADEGKTTSRQEGIYTVAVCDDCFSGP